MPQIELIAASYFVNCNGKLKEITYAVIAGNKQFRRLTAYRAARAFKSAPLSALNIHFYKRGFAAAGNTVDRYRRNFFSGSGGGAASAAGVKKLGAASVRYTGV